jgi:DNA helicase-4
VAGTGLELIDELIACWPGWNALERYYLTELAPQIVRSTGHTWLPERERRIVSSLRGLLSEKEWSQLPELIEARRTNNLKALASDCERADALDAARRREVEEQAGRKKECERQARERRQAQEAEMARKIALIARLQDHFESDFLSADRVLAPDADAELVTGPEYQALKTRFVQDWAARTLQYSLDTEQAAAIAATGGDVQVVARAGSGKTRTLVTRAIFLQKHCGVCSRELLLLAFNKKAAEEMKSRLSEILGADLPHVMTFHALAHALVHPDEELVFDDASADQFGLSREVQEVIDEHVRSREYGPRIRDLMLAHFREDWERIVAGRFELTMDEFLSHRRALPRESLKGDYVKSFGEKVIANALFEHSVEYRYERNFRWNGVNYRPDFTIFVGRRGGVIIEYFGLEGDAEYDKMSQQKRMFWAGHDEWTFLEFSPRDLMGRGLDGFVQLLLREVTKAGVSCQRRTEQEIWKFVKRRALDRFTKAMQIFVSRCRKLDLSPDNLQAMVAGHAACSTAETGFLDVGISVYRGYLARLVAGKKEDFDGLIWRAVSLVRGRQTRFVRDKGRERGDAASLRFVLIDEFQDFSHMFFALVDAIRSVNPRAQYFCVGDDWQAINGFAGSDVRFFEGFPKYFPNSSRCHIRTNHRSVRSVVEVGNALMHGHGLAAEPARDDAGRVFLCNLDDFRPSAAEQARHNGDEITPAVLRVVKHFLDRGLHVVMLSRRHGIPWYVSYGERADRPLDGLVRFLEHVRSYLPEDAHGRVSASTVHQFKGLEQSAVVVQDAVERSYPLLHPTWAFLRIFGDSLDRIEAEERRLFYVAITRAKDSLALLTETRAQSPYLSDIGRRFCLTPASWVDMPPVPSLDGVRVEIRVSDAFNVKDKLKALGYQWHTGKKPEEKYWHRVEMAEGLSIDALLRQPWATGGVTIRVYSETGQLLDRRLTGHRPLTAP